MFQMSLSRQLVARSVVGFQVSADRFSRHAFSVLKTCFSRVCVPALIMLLIIHIRFLFLNDIYVHTNMYFHVTIRLPLLFLLQS